MLACEANEVRRTRQPVFGGELVLFVDGNLVQLVLLWRFVLAVVLLEMVDVLLLVLKGTQQGELLRRILLGETGIRLLVCVLVCSVGIVVFSLVGGPLQLVLLL